MDAENQQAQQSAVTGAGTGAAESGVRANIHRSLARKFMDLMAQYQELQAKYRAKYKERVKRQYLIVNPNATQDDVAKSIDDPQSDVFTQQILQGAGHAAARQALEDIQNRHRDIVRLEASIQELNQLFLHMAGLVAAQDELLDQIENNVSRSVVNTSNAVGELRTANEYKKKRRKYVCWAAIFVVLVAIIIFVPVVL